MHSQRQWFSRTVRRISYSLTQPSLYSIKFNQNRLVDIVIIRVMRWRSCTCRPSDSKIWYGIEVKTLEVVRNCIKLVFAGHELDRMGRGRKGADTNTHRVCHVAIEDWTQVWNLGPLRPKLWLLCYNVFYIPLVSSSMCYVALRSLILAGRSRSSWKPRRRFTSKTLCTPAAHHPFFNICSFEPLVTWTLGVSPS